MYLRPRSKVFKDRHELAKLLKLAKTGKYSAPKLAKLFNCNKKTIFKALEDNNIALPNLGYFPKRYLCNENFFDQLNSISSYWLGFIAADGSLTLKDKGTTIGLALKDKGHLQKFKGAIQADGKIFYWPATNSVKFSIYSKKIFNRLGNLGVLPNKSLNIKNVAIPEDLMSHFIRGVFDGDGWAGGRRVTHLQFMIAGNKPFLEQIQRVLVKECGVNEVKLYPVSGKSRAYKLQYTGFQIFKILEFIYQDSTADTRLSRKYRKYLVLKKKFGKN